MGTGTRSLVLNTKMSRAARVAALGIALWIYPHFAGADGVHRQPSGRADVQETQAVRDARVASLRMSSGNMTVPVGTHLILSATARDAAGSPVGGVGVVWHAYNSPSKKKISMPGPGEFIATMPGSYRIVAKTNRHQTEVSVTVISPPSPIAVQLSPQQLPESKWDETTIPSASYPANRRGRNPLEMTTQALRSPGTRRDALGDGAGAGSGNFSLTVPILDLAGRGLDLGLALTYNSLLWHRIGNNMQFAPDLDDDWPAPGWSIGFGKVAGHVLIDADGTRHVLSKESGQTTDGTFIDCLYAPYPSIDIQCKYPSGMVIDLTRWSIRGINYPERVTDANGNYLTITYRDHSFSGFAPRSKAIDTITDTLGRTITFHYEPYVKPADPYNEVPIAITAPGLHGTRITLARFQWAWRDLELAWASPPFTYQLAPKRIRVLKAVYYPGTATGYWFGDNDSYSSYGMLAKVLQQKGMTFSGASLSDEGNISSGKTTREVKYNLPLRPNSRLTENPTYTEVIENWEGNTGSPSVTKYLLTRDKSNPSATQSQQLEVTNQNGTRFVTIQEGPLTRREHTYDKAGRLMRSVSTDWEIGEYSSPRPARIIILDDIAQTTTTSFSYAARNAVSEIRNYDYKGLLLRRLSTEYETDPHYIKRHIFYLPTAVKTYNSDNCAPNCALAGPMPRFRWNFEGNTSNIGSENGFALTTPAGISFVGGKLGMAGSFGPGQYARVAGLRPLLGTFTDVTIAFWLKEPGNLASAIVADIDNRSKSPFGGVQLALTGTTAALCVSTTSSAFLSGSCGGPPAPSANTFHHWILRYHGTGAGAGMGGPTELYVDGVLVHTRPNDVANDPVFNTTGMPDVFTVGGPGMVVDDVRIYDRVFTPAEQCTMIIGGTMEGVGCTLRPPAAGSETLVARTDLSYDQQPRARAPGVVQHSQSFNPDAPPEWVDGPCETICTKKCRPLEECEPTCHEKCSEGYWRALYDPDTAYRGNVTQITRYAKAAERAEPITESRRYDITGNRLSTTMGTLQATQQYTVGTQYAYPARVTESAPDLPLALGFDPSTYVGQGNRYNCSNFANQAQAQAVLRYEPSDPNRLDGDRNGIACEANGPPRDSRSVASLTTSTIYDFSTGLVLSATGANGRTTSMTYSPTTLRPSLIRHPTGAFTDIKYDDVSLSVTAMTVGGDHVDAVATTWVDGRGLPLRKAVAAERGWDVVETRYDELGRLFEKSQPARRTGDPRSWSPPEWWTDFRYDSLGREESRLAPNARSMASLYNEPTRPRGATAEPGQTLRTRDSLKGNWRWTRTDALGRLVEVVQPNPDGDGSLDGVGNLTMRYLYDAARNTVTIEDGMQSRRFQYDSLGRLKRQALPERSAMLNDSGVFSSGGGAWSDIYTYDDISNVTSHIDARGIRRVYDYGGDPLSRLQGMTYDTKGFGDTKNPFTPTGAVKHSYVTSGDVRRISFTRIDGVGTETNRYDDPEGRLTSTTLDLDNWPSHPLVNSYTYDSLGHVTDLYYPAAYGFGQAQRSHIHYTFSNVGRPKETTLDGVAVASEIDYNAAGLASSIRVGPAGPLRLVETYVFSPLTGLLEKQLVERSGTRLLDLSYDEYRGTRTNQLTHLTDNLNSPNGRIYGYDALGRLVFAGADGGAVGTQWTQKYEYDVHGNRTIVRGSGTSASGQMIPSLPRVDYNPSTNRITNAGVLYDAAGNLSRAERGGVWQRFRYDAAGRLTTVLDDQGAVLERYVYGPRGNRLMTERVQGEAISTTYAWSGDRLLAEYDRVSGTAPIPPRWARSNVYLGERPIAVLTQEAAGKVARYLHPDRVGTRLITEAATPTVHDQQMLPFGDSLDGSATSFTSYDRSAITSLDYAVNRFYDFRYGRFTQPDPVASKAMSPADSQSFNLYSYVRNDPVNAVDPTGLEMVCYRITEEYSLCWGAEVYEPAEVYKPGKNETVVTASRYDPGHLSEGEVKRGSPTGGERGDGGRGGRGDGASSQPSSVMATCPASPPTTSGWKPYAGNPVVFHCDYRTFLEDRTPTRENPIGECSYDESGSLVDDNHSYSGCKGTPDQYFSGTDPIKHALFDSGGICDFTTLGAGCGVGITAFSASLQHRLLRELGSLFGGPLW